MSFRAGHRLWLVIATMLLAGCRPAPPPDAPTDVHYIGGKTPYWRHCAVDPSDRQVHCRTWIGHRLSLNEVFLPYDGGPTPALEELEIFDEESRGQESRGQATTFKVTPGAPGKKVIG